MISHTADTTSLPFAAMKFIRLLAVCIPVLMSINAANAEDKAHPSGENHYHFKSGIPETHAPPSAGAKGMEGAMGTIEFKPKDWKGNVTTYWVDTDGVDPGVAGCHRAYNRGTYGPNGRDWSYNGRTFGEACLGDNPNIPYRFLISPIQVFWYGMHTRTIPDIPTFSTAGRGAPAHIRAKTGSAFRPKVQPLARRLQNVSAATEQGDAISFPSAAEMQRSLASKFMSRAAEGKTAPGGGPGRFRR